MEPLDTAKGKTLKEIDEEDVRKVINYLNGTVHQKVVWDLWGAHREAALRLAAHENRPRPAVAPFPGYTGALPSTIAGTGWYQGERGSGKVDALGIMSDAARAARREATERVEEADAQEAGRMIMRGFSGAGPIAGEKMSGRLKIGGDENVIRAADFRGAPSARTAAARNALEAKARLEGLMDADTPDAVDRMLAEEGRRRILDTDSDRCRWHLLQEVNGSIAAPCTSPMVGYVTLTGGGGVLDLDLCKHHGQITRHTFVLYSDPGSEA